MDLPASVWQQLFSDEGIPMEKLPLTLIIAAARLLIELYKLIRDHKRGGEKS